MSRLRELSTDLLSGAITVDSAHPMSPRFIAELIAPRCYFVSSFANVAAFETGDGLVLVDTGSFFLAERTRVALRSVVASPAHTAIWTHGHVDHCFGVELYEREAGRAVRVIAHDAVTRRFARYRLTRGWNQAINTRQFQTAVAFPSEFREPDETYRDDRALEVGGRRFELHHALGETDDHTWVWVPDAGVVCTGDLFIWASPNCGNPQKVQRYPREWAAALRAIDALGAEVLCPGHGVPIWGAGNVHRALDDTASYLESLVDQVIGLMNRGALLDEIVATVAPPAALAARPYLSPVYDEPEFIVRNLYRLYGGWWDGNPAHLKPAPPAALARELAELAGGAGALARRAEELAGGGERGVGPTASPPARGSSVGSPADPRLACELVELAHLAAPGDPAIAAIRSKIYAARAASERSVMARGVFASVAGNAREPSTRGEPR